MTLDQFKYPSRTGAGTGDDISQYKYSRTTNPPARKDTSKAEAKKAAAKKAKKVVVRSAVVKAPRYDIKLDFSVDDGQTFDSPAEASGGLVIQVRMMFTQHQVFPLLQGVLMRWFPPFHVTWVDGFGTYTYEVCVSNPLVVTRLALMPNASLRSFFKATSQEIYSSAADMVAPELPILRGTANIYLQGGGG